MGWKVSDDSRWKPYHKPSLTDPVRIPRILWCDLFLGFRIETDYLLSEEEAAGEMPEGCFVYFNQR